MLHRWTLAGALAAVVVATSALPAPAQRTTADRVRAQSAAPAGLLRIGAISPWVDATHPFTLTIQVTNQTELALENAALNVSVFGTVSSRSQLRQALDGAPPTQSLGSFGQAIDGTIPAGQQRTITIQQPASVLLGSIARTGVYPVQISLRHSRGTETISTAMPYMPAQPLDPLNVTWVLPISAPTVRKVNGAYTQAAIDSLGIAELTQQLQVIAAHPGANLTLAPDPALLDTLLDLSKGYELATPGGVEHVSPDDLTARMASDLLGQLRHAADVAGEIVTVPYAPVDLPSLAQHGLRGDALRQVTLGRSVTEDVLGRAPIPSVLVPPNLTMDNAALSALAPLGITGVVLNPATLLVQPSEPFQPGLFGPSRPVALGESSLAALLPDAPIAARMLGPEQGVLLAQAIIAETASSYLELPSLGSERVLAIDSSVRLAPTALTAMIEGLTQAPWARMRSVSQALTILPPEGAVLPVPRFARPDRPFLVAARAARLALSTLSSVAVDPLTRGDELDRDILASESAEWTSVPAQGVNIARAARDAVNRMLSGIQVGAGRRVTLTSKSGSVPVTIINKNPFPVRLRVVVGSPKVGFPSGTAKTIEVQPPNDTIDFTVQARATGAFPLDVRVETPNGARLIARGSVILRSSAVSTVALLVVAGSAFFLFVAWGRRARRRSKAAARAEAEASPADTA
ncbi:MAG: DUF6049 family protein [Actinomycetota bacterium]